MDALIDRIVRLVCLCFVGRIQEEHDIFHVFFEIENTNTCHWPWRLIFSRLNSTAKPLCKKGQRSSDLMTKISKFYDFEEKTNDFGAILMFLERLEQKFVQIFFN